MRLNPALWWGRLVVCAGALTIGAGVLLFGLQCLEWLQKGRWDSVELGLLVRGLLGHAPAFSWAGVQKIADWLLDLPLSFSFIGAGWLVIVIGLSKIEEANRSKRFLDP